MIFFIESVTFIQARQLTKYKATLMLIPFNIVYSSRHLEQFTGMQKMIYPLYNIYNNRRKMGTTFLIYIHMNSYIHTYIV